MLSKMNISRENLATIITMIWFLHSMCSQIMVATLLPKMGGAPPKSCLGGGLGGILGGVGGDLWGGFGRILLYCSLSTKYFVLRGKLYINWNLMLWTSKLINAISLSEKYFFVLGSFSWKICEHGFFLLLHIGIICISLRS